MECPKCQEKLQNRAIKSVKFHECVKCQGTWFDADTLRKLKDQTDPDLKWMDFELWRHPDQVHLTATRIPCPACDVELVAVDYDKTGVDVEFCQQCRGVWLDAGKFEKIIDALTLELETKSSSEYVKESLEEAKEIIVGPEDMISEWGDFLTVVRMLHYRFLVENPALQKALLRLQEGLPK